MGTPRTKPFFHRPERKHLEATKGEKPLEP